MPPPSQESRWVGRILRDKWRIDGRIARGGMGTVFAATHRNNGSTAAIKILHPEFSRDEDTRSRFLQEGYAANKVNHPGVVRILDDDVTEEGQAFLVMELLQGELLEQRRIRKGGKLPLPEVYQFADQLLDVLAAAHAKGIVHRDIKPDNLFLTSQGKLKVLDFGFAQMKTTYRPEQTATGFLLGTPGFMAPEQAVGNRPLIDARTDIWAVGATLFLLLTGQPVHSGESAAEQLVAAANFAVRSITTLEPGLPTKVAHVVDRALEFDRDNRWPDARTMQEALRAAPGKNAPPRDPIRSSIVDPSERISPGYMTRPVPPDDVTMRDLVDDVELEDLQRTDETKAAPTHPANLDAKTMAVPAVVMPPSTVASPPTTKPAPHPNQPSPALPTSLASSQVPTAFGPRPTTQLSPQVQIPSKSDAPLPTTPPRPAPVPTTPPRPTTQLSPQSPMRSSAPVAVPMMTTQLSPQTGPSAAMKPPLQHPSDLDGRTVAHEPMVGQTALPIGRPQTIRGVDLAEVPVTDETLVMDNRPHRPDSYPPPRPPSLSSGAIRPPPTAPLPRPMTGPPMQPQGMHPDYRTGLTPTTPTHGTPAIVDPISAEMPSLDMMPAATRQGGSRVLVFVVLAGVTMVIVILLGLALLVTFE